MILFSFLETRKWNQNVYYKSLLRPFGVTYFSIVMFYLKWLTYHVISKFYQEILFVWPDMNVFI